MEKSSGKTHSEISSLGKNILEKSLWVVGMSSHWYSLEWNASEVAPWRTDMKLAAHSDCVVVFRACIGRHASHVNVDLT